MGKKPILMTFLVAGLAFGCSDSTGPSIPSYEADFTTLDPTQAATTTAAFKEECEFSKF